MVQLFGEEKKIRDRLVNNAGIHIGDLVKREFVTTDSGTAKTAYVIVQVDSVYVDFKSKLFVINYNHIDNISDNIIKTPAKEYFSPRDQKIYRCEFRATADYKKNSSNMSLPSSKSFDY